MWIIPSPCEITPFWETIQQNDLFALQRSTTDKPSVWNSVVGTFQALFDVKQAPFRILLKTSRTADLMAGDQAITIAIGNNKRELDENWGWLEEHIIKPAKEQRELDDHRLMTYKVYKAIEELVLLDRGKTDETAADESFRTTARSFRQTFTLPESERLVNFFSCTSKGSLVPGWMYLSEHYLAYYSFLLGAEVKIIIGLDQITEIKKERSKAGLLHDSLSVSIADGRSISFTSMFRRDEAFDLLQQLTNREMQKILKSKTEKVSSPGTSAESPGSPHGTPSKSTMKEEFDQEQMNSYYQQLFRLPSDELVLDRTLSLFWIDGKADDTQRGDLFLSTRFLGFIHLKRGTGGSESVQWCFPTCCIKRLERITGEGDSSSPYDPYAISLVTIHNQRIYVSVGSNLAQCNRFCTRLREALQGATVMANLIPPFMAKLPSSSMDLAENGPSSVVESGYGALYGYPEFDQERENLLLDYWRSYFKEFGRNFTIIRQPLFGRLIRIGLPHILRAEMWEVCSGVLFERFLQPSLYSDLVINHAGLASLSTEEIEKDLQRSLPEYQAFQTKDGIDSLRRVLQSYSWYDPSLGYCQAMNIVSSALLIYATETQAFWILRHLCKVALPGYYSTTMWGVVIDQLVFEDLVRDQLPLLWTHLQKHEMQLSVATTPWFLTIFINTVPLHLSFRILDWFFLDGPKVLFQIALAILELNMDELMAIEDDGQMMVQLREYFENLENYIPPDEPGKRAQTHFHQLILIAYHSYRNEVTMKLIDELRQKHHLKVVRNIGEFTKKATVRESRDKVPLLTEEAIAFFYDRFHQVLSSRNKGALGAEEAEYILIMKSLLVWSEGDACPEVVDRLLRALYRRLHSGFGRLSFEDFLLGIENFLFKLTADDRKEVCFEAYAEGHQMAYDDLIQVSELLLFIFRNAPGEEHLTSVSQFIKSVSVEMSQQPTIGLAQFSRLIGEHDFFQNFFAIGWAESVMLKPLNVKEVDLSDYRPGILSNIWAMVRRKPAALKQPRKPSLPKTPASPRTQRPRTTSMTPRMAIQTDTLVEERPASAISTATPGQPILSTGEIESLSELLKEI